MNHLIADGLAADRERHEACLEEVGGAWFARQPFGEYDYGPFESKPEAVAWLRRMDSYFRLPGFMALEQAAPK